MVNLANLLHRAGKVHPDRPALCLGSNVKARYAEMARRAATLAGWLRDTAGLAPGDRVALAMTNCPAYLEVLYGVWHAGLAAVPINAKLHRDEFGYILDHSGARLCFVTADLAETIGPLADTLDDLARVVVVDDAAYAQCFAGDAIAVADRGPDDLAWLFYTSGTTGRPKGAMLSHRVLLAMTLCYLSDVDTVAPDDGVLHAAPLSHGSGCYNLPHVLRGARQVLPESGRFDPAEIFDLLPRQPGTSMFAAPTMVKRLITHPAAAAADTRNLKTIVYGGGPMYVADSKAAMALLGNKLVQIYGQGESPMTITVLDRAQHADTGHPRYEDRLASVGVAQSVVEMRVADADDRTLPPGEVGEVLARGDVVMTGYWRNPQATAETLRGGWLHTGDMGAVDADGFLTLKDRSKDMIISGGSNIYPREVEELLLRDAAVAEVSVIGRPDPEWGEVVVAFVVPAPGAAPTAEALDALCLQSIARFKRPKQYRFVAALPKNNYGKVLKTALREQLAAEAETEAGA
jgi:long-chain acyl-CoA synthetase